MLTWCSSGIDSRLFTKNEKICPQLRKMCDNGAVYICYRDVRLGVLAHGISQ